MPTVCIGKDTMMGMMKVIGTEDMIHIAGQTIAITEDITVDHPFISARTSDLG